MVVGGNHAWVVQTGDGHVQFGAIVIQAESQLGPTAQAKGARGLWRGPEAGGATRSETEVTCRHGEPRDERSPGGAPANRTVADRLVVSDANYLVANLSAKTAAIHNTIPFSRP